MFIKPKGLFEDIKTAICKIHHPTKAKNTNFSTYIYIFNQLFFFYFPIQLLVCLILDIKSGLPEFWNSQNARTPAFNVTAIRDVLVNAKKAIAPS